MDYLPGRQQSCKRWKTPDSRYFANFPERKSTDDFTQAEILELIAKLESTLFDKMDFKEFVQKIMEQKFAEGLVCPRCQNKHVKKNGFDKKGRQKYKCSKCGSFTATTNTVFSKSKISAGKWLKYADCMNKRMSLRETAKELKICLKTAFNMRHKILGAIVESMGVDNLEDSLKWMSVSLQNVSRVITKKETHNGNPQEKMVNQE